MSDDTQATLPVDDGPLTAPPFLVDRYEVGALIGRGGVGQVHRAIDHRTQEAVAIKFVRTTRHFALRQVRRELTALRALALPGVVRLLDDGMFNGQYFLVMSLVTGQRLDEAMAGLSWEHGAPMVRSLRRRPMSLASLCLRPVPAHHSLWHLRQQRRTRHLAFLRGENALAR